MRYKFSFLIAFMFFFLPVLNLNQNDLKEESSKNTSVNGSIFIDEMNQISASPTTDYDGQAVEYSSSNKTYNLKTNIDFAPDLVDPALDLYDGSHTINLVDDGTFEGNNYFIDNYYDKDSLENHFANMIYGEKYYEDNKMYLFSETNGTDFYNSTFNNSLFIFQLISPGSHLSNVNQQNLNINSLDITIDNSLSITPSKTTSGIFKFSTFALVMGTDTSWTNSYVKNITFSNNTFDIDPTFDSLFLTNGGVSLAPIGTIWGNDFDVSGSPKGDVIISDLEISNWTINNNSFTFKSNSGSVDNNWSNGFFINPIFFFLGEKIHYAGDLYFEDDLWTVPEKQVNTPRREQEGSISLSSIYVHDFYINDNVVLDDNKTTDTLYFNFIPLIASDGVSYLPIKNVVLSNFSGSDINKINVTAFVDETYNTLYNYVDNFIWNEVNNWSQQLTSNDLWELTDNWSMESKNKEGSFSSVFWNTKQNEPLALYNQSNFSFMQKYWNEDNQLVFQFNLGNHNYYLSQPTTVNLEDNNGNVIDSFSVKSNETLDINFSNLDLSYDQTYFLKVNFSDYNTSLNQSLKLNDYFAQDFLIANFSNYLVDDSLFVEFDNYDPLKYYDQIEVDLYNQHRLKESQVFDAKTLRGANQITFNETKKINNNNWYLVFYVIDKDGNKTALVNDSTQMVLGANNFLKLSTPRSFAYYYWWVIIFVIIFVILLILLTIFLISYLRRRKAKNEIIHGLQLLEENYGIAIFGEDGELPPMNSDYYGDDYVQSNNEQEYVDDYQDVYGEEYQDIYDEDEDEQNYLNFKSSNSFSNNLSNVKKSFSTFFQILTLVLIVLIPLNSLFKSEKITHSNNRQQLNSMAPSNKDVLSAQEFIHDLENVSDGGTYSLEQDVDLSTLDPDTNIAPLDNLTIEGNNHKLYNRNFTKTSLDTSAFAMADTNNIMLFSSIENVTINNLTLDNVMFPFGQIIDSNLVGVNYMNTTYENLNFNLDKYWIENSNINNYFSIPLFTTNLVDSSITYSSFTNIKFQNNTMQVPASTIGSIVVSLIPIVTTNDYTKVSNLSNIYVSDILFENNDVKLTGSSSPSPQNLYHGQDDLSSIFFSPLVGATYQHKNDSVNNPLLLNIQNIIFNKVSFINNDAQSITDNTAWKGGVLINYLPAIIPNSYVSITNVVIYNDFIDAKNQLQAGQKVSTGIIKEVNATTGGVSKGIIKGKNIFSYQDEALIQFNNFAYSIISFLPYNELTSIVNDLMYDSESGETGDGFDQKYWTIYSEKDCDAHLKLMYQPTIGSIKVETLNRFTTTLRFSFRQGTFDSDNNWSLKIEDTISGNVFTNQGLVSGQNYRLVLKSYDLFNPVGNLKISIYNDEYEFVQPFSTQIVLPQIFNVHNELNASNKLTLSYDINDEFNLINNIQVLLYRDDNLNEMQNMTPNPTKTSLSTEFDYDFSKANPKDYVIVFEVDTKIGYDIYSNQFLYDSTVLNYEFIDFDSNNYISFGYVNHKLPIWIYIVVSLVIILIILILALLIFFGIRNKNKTTAMISLYNEKAEELGVALYDSEN